MVSQVRFSEALGQLHQPAQSAGGTREIDYVVEIGPHSTLRRPIKDCLGNISYGSVLQKGVPSLHTYLNLAGQLFCAGYKIDFLATNHMATAESNLSMLIDLPEYAFDHSKFCWHESRLSKNFRFRKFPRHELLGAPVADWNPLEAKWRNFIKPNEHPWIRDHVFDGKAIYPAAGLLVMALEAARQVASPNESIKCYRFREVSFSKALILSMDLDGVETELYLRPRKSSGSSTSQWNSFHIYAFLDGGWLEICAGALSTEYKEASAQSDMGHEKEHLRQHLADIHTRSGESCSRAVIPEQMYEDMNDFGFEFGPTFRTLKEISYSDSGEARANLRLLDWRTKVDGPGKHIQRHVIHPTALDGLFQLSLVTITKGGRERVPITVPTKIQDMWISHELLTNTNLDHLTIHSRSTSCGYRDAVFDVSAIDAINSNPLIQVEDYRLTAVSGLESATPEESNWRRLCFNIDLKPDFDMLDHEQFLSYCNDTGPAAEIFPVDMMDKIELACLYFISTTLDALHDDGCAISKSHLRKYVEWMNKTLDLTNSKITLSSPEGRRFMQEKSYRDHSLDEMLASNSVGKAFVTVGRKLEQILREDVDALELLFRDHLLPEVYNSSLFIVNYQKAAAYVDLIAHKDPSISVLEIGAGSGGATAYILRTLEPNRSADDVHGTFRCSQYTYTDISPAFFEAAGKRFEKYSSHLLFKTLDVEKDPLSQGFSSGQYNIILASFVLHATADINVTLENTRKLLKPGGKLILLELCNFEFAPCSFITGLLPGWWLGKEELID